MKKTAAKVLLLLTLLTMTACDRAGAPSASRHSENSAHTHSFGEWVVTAPNCTADGAGVRVCACGEQECEKIPALGHDYIGGICNTCGEKAPVDGLALIRNADGVSCAVAGIGACAEKDLVIDAHYDGLCVTQIGDSAFRACAQLQSVRMADGIAAIGADAFGECTALTRVFIPASVTKIGAYAFHACANLRQISFGGTTAQWNAVEKGAHWDDGLPEYTVLCADAETSITLKRKDGYDKIVLSGNKARFDVLTALENAEQLDPEKLTCTVSDAQILSIEGTVLRPTDNSHSDVTVTLYYEGAREPITLSVRTEKIRSYYLSETEITLSVGASAEVRLFDRFHNAVTDVQWSVSDDLGEFCTTEITEDGILLTATRVTEHVAAGGYVYLAVRDPDGKERTCKIYIHQ